MKKNGDIHFWMNGEELNKGGAANPALAMLNMNKLYEGSITAATVNFENGKILLEAKSYAGKELTGLYKKYGGKNFDETMIKRLPVKELAAVFAMSFKPEGIKELLKVLGVDGLANMGLAQLGINLDEFIKANKGDILIAVTGLQQKNLTDSSAAVTNNSFIQPDVIFSTSIADKDAFNLLIKAGEKIGNNIPANFPLAYNTDGKYFAIGNTKENIDKYITGGSNNSFDFLSKINNNPFGGYVNLQYILKAFETSFSKDSAAKVVYEASLKMWDNIYMKGGNFEDGGMVQSGEINLMDKSTNSLKQLNQYIGLLSKIKIEQDKKIKVTDIKMEEIYKDKMPVPPPPPVKKRN